MTDSLVGRFATSKAGHDKTRLYVIIAEEGDFVSLCDGRLKTVDKPKKKRRKHIQLINRTVSDAVLQRLFSNRMVRNEEIKYEIACYERQLRKDYW